MGNLHGRIATPEEIHLTYTNKVLESHLSPLVSVIIPTHKRPQYLPRAVESALTCQSNSVEVIVIPNGDDNSWKQSLLPWKDDTRVRISPINTAHGNTARNHGMSLATGKYIRFLDDDDYLLPGARTQIEMMEKTGADICSGTLENIDEDGTNLGTLKLLQTQDFVCASTTISGFTLPVGNVFKKEALNQASWDTTVNRLQDNAWMIDLAIAKEWKWVHCNDHVGVWFQHRAPRVSSSAKRTPMPTDITDRLQKLAITLERGMRLNSERRQALASILWFYAHPYFTLHPLYCTRMAKLALHLSPDSYPTMSPYIQNLHCMGPLLLEWLLLIPRKISFLIRGINLYPQESDHRRYL